MLFEIDSNMDDPIIVSKDDIEAELPTCVILPRTYVWGKDKY